MWACGVRDKIAAEVEVDERADIVLASIQVAVLNPVRTRGVYGRHSTALTG